MWSLKSPHTKSVSGPKNLCSSVQKRLLQQAVIRRARPPRAAPTAAFFIFSRPVTNTDGGTVIAKLPTRRGIVGMVALSAWGGAAAAVHRA